MRTLDEIKDRCKKYGLESSLIIDSIIGVTPIVPLTPIKKNWCNRMQEVVKWIRDNKCEDYIVIDDWDMTNQLGERMINTKTEIGLTEELKEKAISVFNRGSKGLNEIEKVLVNFGAERTDWNWCHHTNLNTWIKRIIEAVNNENDKEMAKR